MEGWITSKLMSRWSFPEQQESKKVFTSMIKWYILYLREISSVGGSKMEEHMDVFQEFR